MNAVQRMAVAQLRHWMKFYSNVARDCVALGLEGTAGVKARHAFTCAGELIERLRVRDSLANTVVRNQQERAYRLAVTPRCKYRKVTVFGDNNNEIQHRVGDPCGGKLVVKTLHREAIDAVCKVCGRSANYAVNASESQEPVKEAA